LCDENIDLAPEQPGDQSTSGTGVAETLVEIDGRQTHPWPPSNG
jgi:hypothetical protein